MTLVNRIDSHANTSPCKAAAFVNGRVVSHRTFAQSIELIRSTWRSLNLPAGNLAVVVVNDRLLDWCFVLALKSLGVGPLSADSVERAHALNLKQVSGFIVIKPSGEQLRLAQEC